MAGRAATHTAQMPPGGPRRVATDFVSRSGAAFDLDGSRFRFGGSTNYCVRYSSQFVVNVVLDDAQAMGLVGWADAMAGVVARAGARVGRPPASGKAVGQLARPEQPPIGPVPGSTAGRT
jgi:hypothetical protein